MPEISVIICTYNRSSSLKDLLESLLIQEVTEEFTYEVIVVDNNSGDNTKEIVDSYISKFQGRLRYLFEPRQGKPFALNLGIQEARGELLAFTDDDCILEKNYLVEIHKTFKEYGSKIGIVGGKISPKWENSGKQPKWLTEFYPLHKSENIKWQGSDKPERLDEFFLGPLGILDCGSKPFIIDYSQDKRNNQLFYGANIIIRKELLNKFGYFNLDKTLTQDSEICLRLFKAGVKGLYMPQINVYHKINNSKPSYYYKWHYSRGKYDNYEIYSNMKYFQTLEAPIRMIKMTLKLFIKSLFVKSFYQKMFYRLYAFRSFGKTVEIIKSNINNII
jgi:glycosyltransferase involved in cell wall biosynthesis